MAVTFDAVGPSSAGTGQASSGAMTWTHTAVASGVTILAAVSVDASGTWSATATCDGTSMTALGTVYTSAGSTESGLIVFSIAGQASGAHTIVVTPGFTGTFVDQEGGSLSFAGAAGLGTPYTSSADSTPSVAVTANTSGNLIAGFIAAGNTISASGNTSRFIINEEGGGGGYTGNCAGSTAAATGSPVTMSWTCSSTSMALLAVEVQGPAGPASGASLNVQAALAASNLGIPGLSLTAATPGEAVPAAFTPAVIPVAGVYTGGALAAVTASLTAAGTVAHSSGASLAVTATAEASSAPPAITGVTTDATTGGYWHDQGGNPRFAMMDNPWALIVNAGDSGNSGTWQGDMSAYCEARAGQGFTVVYVAAIGCLDFGPYENGNTWDGVAPFTSGDPSAGLNDTYWERVDYLIAQAAANGMTVFLNIAYTADGTGHGTFDSGGALYDLTETQYADYGTALGDRYKDTANLVWVYGNDYYNSGATALDTQFGYIRSAIIATGDTHAMAVHNYPESTERYDIETSTGGAVPSTFSSTYGQVNWVYSYNVLYFGIELAYEEAATHSIAMLPAMWGDGLFYGTGSYNFDAQMRQMTWWAIAAGARGVTNTSNNVYPWGPGALDDVETEDYFVNEAPNIVAAYTSLPGWQELLPDTSSALVTSGRGTRASGITTGSNYTFGVDDYVVASRGPDSGSGASLAVIYCAKAFSITIDESKMATGYTATWVDPASGTTTAATTGSSYSSSGLGNNSAGFPDWALVLQGPSGLSGSAALSATVTLAAGGSVATATGAVLAVTASLTAAGTAATTSAAALAVTAILAAAGSVAAASGGTLPVTGTLAVTSSAANAPALAVTAALAAAGTVAGGGVSAGASLAATATATAAGTADGTATLAAAATLAAGGNIATTAGAALAPAAVLTAAGNLATASGASLTVTATTAATSAGDGAASLAASAGLTAAGNVATASSATSATAATLTAAGTAAVTGSASLAITAALTSNPAGGTGSAAALACTAALSAAGNVATAAGTSLAAAAVLTAGGTAGGASALAVTTALAAAGITAAASPATIPVTATLTATGNVATASGAVLAVTAAFTANPAGGTVSASALNVTVALAAAGQAGGGATAAFAAGLTATGNTTAGIGAVAAVTFTGSAAGTMAGARNAALVATVRLTAAGVAGGIASRQPVSVTVAQAVPLTVTAVQASPLAVTTTPAGAVRLTITQT